MKHEPARQFCLKCLITLVLIALVILASFAYLSLNPLALFTKQAMNDVAVYTARFFPPDLTPSFLQKVWSGVLQTLAISALATLLAAIASLFFALPAAGQFGHTAKMVTRFFLNFLRSVPELVWAVLMVLAVGLGPFAGTLALTLHTTGVLGRLFGETLENHPPQSTQALQLAGASNTQAFIYGALPGIYSQLLSYSLYRWEMNIRMATILGFVGAGGLGQILYYELSLLHEQQASTVIMAMLILVIGVDMISNKLRRVEMHSLG
jgi:phosphonate transport system permease protein